MLMLSHNYRMTQKVVPRFKKAPRHFIKEWRKFRELTQEQLAERVEMKASSVSQIEHYKQGWTDDTLAWIADALDCTPGDLLTRNPLDTEAPWSIWENLKPQQRKQALIILKALQSGTDG